MTEIEKPKKEPKKRGRKRLDAEGGKTKIFTARLGDESWMYMKYIASHLGLTTGELLRLWCEHLHPPTDFDVKYGNVDFDVTDKEKCLEYYVGKLNKFKFNT